MNLCNRAAAPAKQRVALTDGAAPVDADWIEYDTLVQAAGAPGGSVLQLTDLALGGGQKIYARASAAGVSAVVLGIQEAAAYWAASSLHRASMAASAPSATAPA